MFRHPIGAMGFGIIFALMTVDSYLKFGFHMSLIFLGLFSVSLFVGGGYIWYRWFEGRPKLVINTGGVLIFITILFTWLGPGLGYTPEEKAKQDFVSAELKLLGEREQKSPDIWFQYYYAKTAEFILKRGDEFWAKESLRLAIENARNKQVAGIGRLGTMISPKARALLPETRWTLSRNETLVRFSD